MIQKLMLMLNTTLSAMLSLPTSVLQFCKLYVKKAKKNSPSRGAERSAMQQRRKGEWKLRMPPATSQLHHFLH